MGRSRDAAGGAGDVFASVACPLRASRAPWDRGRKKGGSMADRNKAALGTVAWVDLQTPDLDLARKFYGELLGWSFTGGDDATHAFYTTAQMRGRKVAGLAKVSGQTKLPPAWTVYFATD